VKRGTAYVDIVKEGQTILTHDLDIENGQAELTVAATPDWRERGLQRVSVWARCTSGGRSPAVFVQPADELKIEASANAAVYKPGGEARVRFRVTNAKGKE